MEFLATNWSWLLVIFSIFGIGVVQLFKDENPNSRYKTWINIILMCLVLVGGIGGMFNTLQDEIAQTKLKATLDSTKGITSATLSLADLTVKVTKQIDSIEKLDLQITRNTESLTKDGKNLTTKNILLTSKLNLLTETAKDLVDKIYDEQTSGNSIPLVSAITFADEIIPAMVDELDRQGKSPTGKYWFYLELTNTDFYKLLDISISSKTRNNYNYKDETPGNEIYSGNLLPKEKRKLVSEEICRLGPEVNNDGDTLEYNLRYEYDEITELTVSWRTYTYRYLYEVIKVGKRILSVKDSYVYNGKRFNQKGFKDAILKDMEREKKLLKKQK